jgi:hypothetical protein
MSWSEQFDEPVELTKDIALPSLRDAANYFIDLPASKSIDEHWQLARRFLVSAAEGKGSVWLARIAVVRALDHEKRSSTVGKREPTTECWFARWRLA